MKTKSRKLGRPSVYSYGDYTERYLKQKKCQVAHIRTIIKSKFCHEKSECRLLKLYYSFYATIYKDKRFSIVNGFVHLL